MSEQAGPILLPGTEIAGYRIERELGRGAMAVVYRAIQLNLERPVALKVLSPELASSQEFVGRLFNEARAAAALSHASIVQAYDAGLAEGDIYYFAMEYVEGETVQDRIRREGPLPPRTALRMAADIADALDYGWQRQRLTHGDIKPENIMVNTEGETKLADFGLAKVDGHDFAGSGVMLTPLYASPEAIRGELQKDDCRGDIYAFGATLYHMLSGQPPFPGAETEAVLERHLSEELTPLSEMVGDLPPGVSDLVGSLLAKDAAARPQDWRAVRSAVQRLTKRKARPVRKMKVATPVAHKAAVARGARERRTPPVLPFVIVAAVLAALAVVFAAMRGGDDSVNPQKGAPAAVVPEPPPPRADGPAASDVEQSAAQRAKREEAEKRVQKLWDALQPRLASLADDPEKGIGAVRDFEGKHGAVWTPPDLAVRLKDLEAALAWRAAARKDVPPVVPPTEVVEEAPKEENARPRPVPRVFVQPREVQREEAFVRLCAVIRAFPYRPGATVDALVGQANAWRKAYPEESDRGPLVRLIAESFLPALDECIPKLVANGKALVGKRVVLPRKRTAMVHQITLDRLTVYRKNADGSVRERLVWSELKDLRPLLMLCHHAFGSGTTALRDRRPYLALALISRDDSWWTAATAKLPGSPELVYWRALRTEYAKAQREGQALALWGRVQRAFADGKNDAEAYRLARELRAKRSEVTDRHLAELDQVDAVCSESVPEVKAGRLVREIQEIVKTSPLQALQSANLVRARYGALRFPERDQLLTLRAQSLAAIQRPQQLAAALARQSRQCFCTQLSGSWGSPPHRAMLAYQDLSSAKKPPARFRSAEPFAKLIALAELGDWGAAAEQLASCSPSPPGRPPEFKACAQFAIGLVGERFPGKALDIDPLKTLGTIATAQRLRGDVRAQLATMRCEYAVITRRCREPVGNVLLTDVVEALPTGEHKASFALVSLAVHLEAGRHAEAARLLTEFGTDASRRSAYRFTRIHGELLKAFGDFVANGTPVPPDLMELPFGNHERFLRLAVSVLSVHPDKAGPGMDRLVEQVHAHGTGLGPLGGSAVYDLVCLRIAAALREGNLARAQSAVEWGLGQTGTALFPYYPKLLFLKAGLARVAGDTGEQRAIMQQVLAATMVSRAETALVKLLDPAYPAQRVVDSIRKDPSRNRRFWFEWLQKTLTTARAPAAKRAGIARGIHNRECPLAESLLTPALAKYYLR